MAKPKKRSLENLVRENADLAAELARRGKYVQELQEKLRLLTATHLRSTSEALKKYAEYDAELSKLRKHAAGEMAAQADIVDPPKAPAGKPGTTPR